MPRHAPVDDPDGPRVDVHPPDPTPTSRRLPLILGGLALVAIFVVGVITVVASTPTSPIPTPQALPGSGEVETRAVEPDPDGPTADKR